MLVICRHAPRECAALCRKHIETGSADLMRDMKGQTRDDGGMPG